MNGECHNIIILVLQGFLRRSMRITHKAGRVMLLSLEVGVSCFNLPLRRLHIRWKFDQSDSLAGFEAGDTPNFPVTPRPSLLTYMMGPNTYHWMFAVP